MEILVEIALGVLQFLAELLLQIVLELLAESGLHSAREVFKRPRPASPLLAAFGYCLLGAAAGWISLLFIPDSLIRHSALRIANLVVMPIAAGLLMALVGAWRQRRDQELIRLDRFTYGFLFALSTALVRFFWVHHG